MKSVDNDKLISRIEEVLNYLRYSVFPASKIPFSQKELSVQIDMAPGNISNAKKGDKRYVNALFEKINNRFCGIFNRNWYLTGEGEMLNPGVESSFDKTNLHNAINARVLQVINDYFNKSIPEFCKKLKLSQALVQTTIDRNAPPSYDILIAIINDESLNISAEWLMTGEGEAFKISNTISIITEDPSSDKDIKILDIRVCAGHGIGFDGEENKIIGYVNIPDFTGCYGVTVYGDSMYNKYASGDTIFVREITDKRNIDNGQPYVVITNEDRLLKMVYIEDESLTLVSYNTSLNPDGRRKYPDIKVDGNQILHLYKVVGRLERTQM